MRDASMERDALALENALARCSEARLALHNHPAGGPMSAKELAIARIRRRDHAGRARRKPRAPTTLAIGDAREDPLRNDRSRCVVLGDLHLLVRERLAASVDQAAS